MNCLELERLLDVGEPDALPAAALAHVRECARCERALARARSLERALALHFAATLASGEQLTASFTERVLARVERVEARGVRWLALPDALPWWVRVPAEPPVALAAALAALLLWRGDVFFNGASRAWSPALAVAQARLAELMSASGIGALAQVLARTLVPGPDAGWGVVAAMAIAATPLLALAGYGMWRLGERLVGRPGIPLPH
jgi:hypothetical protein